jgi:2-methylcitrate dehydratase PrpD
MEVTETIVNYVAGLNYDSLPSMALHVAKTAFIDCIGVTLAGSTETSAKICAQLARQERATQESTVFGQGFSSSASQAAFVNGTAAHALDFDHSLYLGQPTSAVIPALLANGEAIGASGRDLLVAYAAGFEVTAKMARSIPEKGRGQWHSAGTLGTFGATVSCAKLLRLRPDQLHMALGIAAAMASGVVCNYGTMSKPLDSGLAARNGVTAAKLAQAGFNASPKAIEADTGFYGAYISLPPDLSPFAELGQCSDLLRGIKIKPYPCGGLSHNAIDAVLEMRSSHAIDPEHVEAIDVEVAGHAYNRLVYRVPQTGLQGKFSMGYVLARAMIDGKVSVDAFTDAAVREPPYLEFSERVRMKLDPKLVESSTGARPCNVTMRLKNGQTLSRYVEHAKGGAEKPLTAEELREKFLDCARRVIDEKNLPEVVASLESLESIEDIRPICRSLIG